MKAVSFKTTPDSKLDQAERASTLVRLTRYLVPICVAAVSTLTASAAEPLEDIRQTVQNYLDGTQLGNPELMEDAFAPSLEVQWIGEHGELNRHSAAEYIEMFRDLRYPGRRSEITMIDATDTAATVKADTEWMGRRYTDYMLLLKIHGEWKMTNIVVVWKEISTVEAALSE